MDTPKLNGWLLAIRDAAKPTIQKPPPHYMTALEFMKLMRLGASQIRKMLSAAGKAGKVRKIFLYQRTPTGQVRRVPFYGPPDHSAKSR